MRLIRCAARLSLSTSFQRDCYSSFHNPSRVMLIVTEQQASSVSDASDSITLKHYNNFLSADGQMLGEMPESKSLVMINSATMDIELVRRLWRYCDYKICADGGANRLFDGLSSSEVADYVPGASFRCLKCFSFQTHHTGKEIVKKMSVDTKISHICTRMLLKRGNINRQVDKLLLSCSFSL